mgnify:FL=1
MHWSPNFNDCNIINTKWWNNICLSISIKMCLLLDLIPSKNNEIGNIYKCAYFPTNRTSSHTFSYILQTNLNIIWTIIIYQNFSYQIIFSFSKLQWFSYPLVGSMIWHFPVSSGFLKTMREPSEASKVGDMQHVHIYFRKCKKEIKGKVRVLKSRRVSEGYVMCTSRVVISRGHGWVCESDGV